MTSDSNDTLAFAALTVLGIGSGGTVSNTVADTLIVGSSSPQSGSFKRTGSDSQVVMAPSNGGGNDTLTPTVNSSEGSST